MADDSQAVFDRVARLFGEIGIADPQAAVGYVTKQTVQVEISPECLQTENGRWMLSFASRLLLRTGFRIAVVHPHPDEIQNLIQPIIQDALGLGLFAYASQHVGQGPRLVIGTGNAGPETVFIDSGGWRGYVRKDSG